jgi:type III pantothenate kinase
MLLAIDIGNTNISFGLFQGNKLIKRFDIPTKDYTLQRLKNKLSRVKVKESIICSVVPDAARVLEEDLKRFPGKRPYIIGKDIRVPIKNLYRKPGQVGQDRLVNAYAGIEFYGSPLIVVDFGTAVTFDVISTNKEYLGGMILPGLRISLDALREKTALLPKINLSAPGEFIGRDTKSSMLSGLVYGFAALTDDLSKRIKEKIGRRAKVIGTGGNIGLIGRYCRSIDKIDKDLTLKGLNLIYNNN